jgi:NAD(P)-dependent dehydrogenase (short-subunit alcohol dehydrogenase family)
MAPTFEPTIANYAGAKRASHAAPADAKLGARLGDRPMPQTLQDRIAIVTGATRGAGRGIACMLGEAGATVYCSGRSTRDNPATPGRRETIEETAERVTAAGGRGIAVRTDHSDEGAVCALVEQVIEDAGRIDILVNDIWGGDDLTEWQPFWTLDSTKGFAMLDCAVRTHVLTSRHVVPHMIERRHGLVVEITDGDHMGYRGTLFYDLAKTSVIRLAFAMAEELRPHRVTALAVTPGFLRSEAMLERMGVTEGNWRDAAAKARGWIASETPSYVGRAVAALAADPEVHRKAGKVFASWTLAKEHGFTDVGGDAPSWGDYIATSLTEILDRGGPADDDERFWIAAWHSQLKAEPNWRPLMERMEALSSRSD